ncbi:MAG: hypothetical protein RIR62_2146 [Pseudomonadota bacterium]|jgi:hypothetical protein
MTKSIAEKQIVLLKLIHEFDTAPDFGKTFVSDADSLPQKWIARVGALMKRSGIAHEVSFRAWTNTSVQYWGVSRDSLRRLMASLIEEIKLELELDGDQYLGQVYDANRQFDFFRDLSAILGDAKKEVFVIDPYLDGHAFSTYLTPVLGKVSIRVLCSRYADEVLGAARAYTNQFNSAPEIRKSKEIHDRLVIIDKSDCWIVGGSIKDAGKNPTYLIPLHPSIAPEKLKIYEGLWSSASIS